MRFCIVCWLLLGAGLFTATTHAAQALPVPPKPVCTQQGIQPRPASFEPGGLILTTFDRAALWVYNIDTGQRYPLPDTVPCRRNCHLSPDRLWFTLIDPTRNFATIKMRLDGTERTPLVVGAADVEWWSDEWLLVWTPDHTAYLTPEDNTRRDERTDFGTVAAVSIQPGGGYAVSLRFEDDTFQRELVNLAAPSTTPVPLGEDRQYFNESAWSPNGDWLVYAAPGPLDNSNGTQGAELFGIRPGETQPQQLTDLFSAYGAVRINGQTIGDLVWSPDSARVAFWVTELTGPDPVGNTGTAVIHVLDLTAQTLTAYCGFATTEHTPNTPRLAWSPDGSHIAFGGNIPGDEKGYLLLALNVTTGALTELSNGIFPALGTPDVLAWGPTPP